MARDAGANTPVSAALNVLDGNVIGDSFLATATKKSSGLLY
jgi:hypothetical protein